MIAIVINIQIKKNKRRGKKHGLFWLQFEQRLIILPNCLGMSSLMPLLSSFLLLCLFLQLFMGIDVLTAQTIPQTRICTGLYIPDGLLPSKCKIQRNP